MISSKLRFFSASCMVIGLLGFIAQLYCVVHELGNYFFGLFTVMILLLASGIELIRRELESIKASLSSSKRATKKGLL